MTLTTQLATLQARHAQVQNATTVLNSIGKIPTNLPQIAHITPYLAELTLIMNNIESMLTWATDIDGVIGNDIFSQSIVTDEGANRQIEFTHLETIRNVILTCNNVGDLVQQVNAYPEVTDAVRERLIHDIRTIVNFDFYDAPMTLDDLEYALDRLSNLPSSWFYDTNYFEDPIVTKYKNNGAGTTEKLERFGINTSDGKPNYFFPASAIENDQELRREAVLSTFDIWTHYGYMLHHRPSGLSAVETLIGWVNYWEHSSLVVTNSSSYPLPEVAALQTFIMFDLIRNTSGSNLGIPIFLNNIPIQEQENAYQDYMNRLETYLIIPGSIHSALRPDFDDDGVAEWFLVAMSEWSVLIHRPALGSQGDLRTGLPEMRLLNSLDGNDIDGTSNNELNFTRLAGYANFNFYNDMSDDEVTVAVVNPQGNSENIDITIPIGRETWGGTEFQNKVLWDYYWNIGQNGQPGIVNLNGRSIRLYEYRQGSDAENVIYFLTIQQRNFIKGNLLNKERPAINNNTDLES